MFRTLAVSLLSLLLCASVAFAEKPLVVASDPTFPPNEMLNKDKEIRRILHRLHQSRGQGSRF